MNKVLIVIDAQEDFTRGALRNEEAIKALPVIHDIVELAKEKEMKIIYTADTHREDYLSTQEGKKLPIKHCIYRTSGWDLCPEVKAENYPTNLIIKEAFGSIGWQHYANTLFYADEIWLCGFCTDICVMANFQILKAQFPEVPITIIEDACAGVTPELHEAALKVMKSCQAKVVKFSEFGEEKQ